METQLHEIINSPTGLKKYSGLQDHFLSYLILAGLGHGVPGSRELSMGIVLLIIIIIVFPVCCVLSKVLNACEQPLVG